MLLYTLLHSQGQAKSNTARVITSNLIRVQLQASREMASTLHILELLLIWNRTYFMIYQTFKLTWWGGKCNQDKNIYDFI